MGPQHEEERWKLHSSPSQHRNLSSHCLGPIPASGVIAAVWNCGEYFAFLLSQGSFSSSSPHTATLPPIKHVSNCVVSTVATETMLVCVPVGVSGGEQECSYTSEFHVND